MISQHIIKALLFSIVVNGWFNADFDPITFIFLIVMYIFIQGNFEI